MPHTIVLGAGITGVTTAHSLLKRGHQVTLVEKHRYPAMETSFANGGQLSASNAEVWNQWQTVWKGLTWVLKRDAPLLLNLSPSWHKYSWLFEFLNNISGYRRNTIATVDLALRARTKLLEIADEYEIDFDLERRGILHVYYDRAGFERAGAVNNLLRQGGLDRWPVTNEEIRTIEPALGAEFYGGFYTPSDATGDIHKFTRSLAKICERQGARFYFDRAVIDIEASGRSVKASASAVGAPHSTAEVLEADNIVICAGVASRTIGARLGDRVNIYPVKGYSITVHLDDQDSQGGAPEVSLLDDRAKIVTSRLGLDRFRVAGTAEFNGTNKDIRTDRIKPLVDWTRTLFPSVATARVVPWSGLRPMMPNMLPKIGRGKRPGVYYNTGHGHLGWTLSCATSEIVADLIVASGARP
ncbi:D-amino acid dehydrogenase [Sinorhizobium meliloti]|uniref:D-amino acid dehydrogenase n=1 Tax=Rhizobium meliloti TaxID=382 RepID=UPI0012973F93|nr:D-amino acid dehydrogenase [Sinorhizobium meliloti]MDW9433671.1 D-amino acid dehydrogenase [Sinorhizobium meliloti]MQV81408.1 D-amino acid dehydrogenase [Sinorhizobium meliloti]